MQLTESQVKEIQERINLAAPKVGEILKEHSLAVNGKVVKVEIGPGVFADTVQVGYVDTKYTEKPGTTEQVTEEVKTILKED